MAEDETNEQQDGGENGDVRSRFGGMMNKDVLIPIAATAVTAAAAGFAIKKAPELKEKIAGEAKQGAQELGKDGAEGAKEAILGGGGPLGAIASGASKLLPGGKGKDGKKKTRRLPIQRWTDVAVPVEEAYERWSNFDDFPKFMHRVLKVEQKDDGIVNWEEKIWFSKRQWQGEITDQRENDRIAWKTVSGTSHSGIVSFHSLDDNLTRVLVTVDFQPAGMIEKMGSGLRFAKRAVQADLARFKAFAELGEAKGIEYEVAPKSDKKDDDGKDEDGKGEQAGGDGQEASGSKDAGEDEGSSEGSKRNGSDPDEREEERRERDQRRKERREALTAR